jgi:alanyl-tRNA synthetase
MNRMCSYEREPYLRELATSVVEIGRDGGRAFAILADTILYPEGGGQPGDRGALGDAPVIDVQRVGGLVRHYLERPVPLGPVTVTLNWRRRFDHMQQHTAQHLLTAIAADRFGWRTTAFHLGEEVCDIELAAERLAHVELDMLEDAVAAEIHAARRVSTHHIAAEHLGTLPVRTRGLPEGHEADVRLVEIAGVDLNTCGGTHVRSSAEIEALKLLGTEPMRGGTRLFFVAGRRLRARLGEHEARCAALRTILGAPDAGLAEAAQAKLDQLHLAEKQARDLESELADALAESLAAEREAVVERHFDGRDVAFLQRVARRLGERAPGKIALLTATRSGQSFFVLAVGEVLALDVKALGREVAARLQGRGGGAGRVFQGRAGSLAARAEIVSRLRVLVHSTA